ncbi:methionyl-tRNA formyltransferase [Winogradskyella litorisediminis]|uniref:Methionyl-tRNA formyltransferase n=1 Tax=Winogradskyella litorisediminis TaxID=1156618 RepID=A0ABW3NC73_9FLAO
MTEKRDIRIVFMGTPDFAVHILKTILEQKYKVVGVITAPDKPAGRGRKLKSSAVKEFALEHNLKVLQPTNLKSEIFVEELKSLNANLQIVVAFRMLPKVVWQMPEYGTFNLHASLLPNYRGAAPIHWAIINGEEKTGVTTFFIDEKIDTGAIILKEETKIGKNETVGELHDKLMHLGSDLVVKTIQQIKEDSVETKIQPTSEDLKTAYKLNRDNCKIDWNENLDTIYNKIRGLNPFPTAWCYLNNGDDENLSVKLYDVSKSKELHNLENGALKIIDKEIKVACKNGFIIIEELQLPNKRKMDAKSLLNGYNFENNAKLL